MTTTISIEKLRKLKDYFDEIDENKDGLVSKEELRKAYNKQYPDFSAELLEGVIGEIWREADENGDGFIEYLIMSKKKMEEDGEDEEEDEDEDDEENEDEDN